MYPAIDETAFAIVYLIVYFFILIYGAYSYIGMGLGGFRMMRRAGVRNPWLSWIPMANVYALGNLADHQTAVNEGKVTNYRKKLLAWYIVSDALLSLVIIAAMIVSAVATANGMVDESGEVEIPENDMKALVGPVLFFLLVTLVFAALYIVYQVYYYVVLHKIHKLFAPHGAAGLTVLSIFVPVAIPAVFLVLSGRAPTYVNGNASDDALPPPTDPAAPTDMGQSFYSL